MLKITVLEEPDVVAIKLDGRLGGPWTTELDRTWKTLTPSLGPRKLSLDLCDMTYADSEGQQLLRKIFERGNATFVANTPLSKHFAAEAMSAGKKMEN
jgi:hypothetical protein